MMLRSSVCVSLFVLQICDARLQHDYVFLCLGVSEKEIMVQQFMQWVGVILEEMGCKWDGEETVACGVEYEGGEEGAGSLKCSTRCSRFASRPISS